MSNIINIGGTSGGSGSSVVPNPQGAATDTLVKVGIDGTIYDFAGGGSTHNYSTTEQVVGTWIDGSTLYEKTIAVSPTALTPSTTIAHNIANIDIVVDYDIFLSRNNGLSVKLQWSTNSNASTSISVDNTNIIFNGTDTWSASDYKKLYATIRYTKSTT